MDNSPIVIAEQLLDHVKRMYEGTEQGSLAGSSVSPSEFHKSKYEVENLCSQLVRSVLGPLEYTVLLAESCQESSALGFINQLGVADILGDETKTIVELSSAVGAREKYLKVAMSCLIRHGYFEEVETDEIGSPAYRNNPLSSVLRVTHPTTLKDAVGFICDEGFKATSHLLPVSKPITPENPHATLPAVNLAFGFQQSVFDWMAKETWRGKRMGNAMQQLHRMANSNVIHDFDWGALTSPIIDVGGGIGSLEMALLSHRPQNQFQFIIFDIPKTIENANKVWNERQIPEGSSISFQVGNFMAKNFEDTSLPVGQPTYIIRHVLHDWTDEEVLHILKHAHTAMSTEPVGPRGRRRQPKLLLCEMLLRPSSPRFIRTTSMQLLALNNGLTRTETEMIKLVEKAGFSVTASHEMRAADTIIEAVLQ